MILVVILAVTFAGCLTVPTNSPEPTSSPSTMLQGTVSVEIKSPEDGASLRTNLLKVTGTVSISEAVVLINGIRTKVHKDGTFYAYLELSEGRNTIEVVATMVDSKTSHIINVTFDPPLVLVLDWPKPEQGIDYTKAPVKISGYVSHPEAKVTVDGIQAKVEKDSTYLAEIRLKEGLNSVEIEATLGEKREYIRHSIDVTREGSFIAAPPMGGARLGGPPDIKLKAGEVKSVDITLQTGTRDIRRPSELRWEIYRVSKLYGKEQLSMLEGLDVSIEPPRFMVYPGRTYLSTVTVRAAPDLSPGEYFFHIGSYINGESALSTGFEVIIEA